MYSQSVINRNLAMFQQREGWLPMPHTIPEVDEFKEYVASLTKTDTNSRNTYITLTGKVKKERADAIRRFIQNEQAMCCLDASYFETRYAYISNESRVMRFTNRDSQKVFDRIIAEHEEKQFAIELFILKARQQGITTKVAMRFLHRLLFLPHTNAVMASVQDKQSQLISRIIETCLNNLPWWLTPRKTKDKLSELGFDNHSLLSIQSGSQATGIAQGWTPNLVHISEIGDIPNPKKTLEEGLFRATHPSRNLFAVYEGTGNGNTGWQAKTWRAAKEDWPKQRSRLRPVFIPWPLAPDLYPTPDFIRQNSVPAGWKPKEATRKHVQRCEMYIRSTDYLANICGKDWRMPIEQQWFWEFNYDNAVKKNEQRTWFTQMPADDFEALTGKNDTVFAAEVTEQAEERRERSYQAYAITGDSIDDGFEPQEEEIDYDKERIRVVWNSHRGQRFEWVMVPLKPFDENEEREALTKVLVFEEPKEGYDYSFGIDTADGLGTEDEDRSVLSGTHNVTGDGCDRQVVEFTSNRVNAPQMVGFAACLAAWYGANTKDPRGVKFAIEQRMRPGDDCQLQLKLMGFNYHHVDVSYDGKKVNESKGTKEGWYTRQHTRAMLLNRFTDALVNGWYKPNSKWLIDEIKDMERKTLAGGKTRMEHQSGKHDDRFFAAAMSYFTRHALDVMADRSQKRYTLPTGKDPELEFKYSSQRQISVGEM